MVWLCCFPMFFSGLYLAWRHLSLLKIPVLAGMLLVRPVQAQANTYPYSCKWISQVSANAVISFSSTNGVGIYNGSLYYKGKRLLSIYEGAFQGYGSSWWSSSLVTESRSGHVIKFYGNYPARAVDGKKRTSQEVKLLVVGLGSSLWYGKDHSWRNNPELLRAAEGFWVPSSGCRHHR